LKILHIAKFYPPEPGGIENFVSDLAEEQAKKGHEVLVLAHQSGFGLPTDWKRRGKVEVGRVRSFGQAAYVPVAPEFSIELYKVQNRFRPDLVHAHMPNASAFWLLFAKLRVPLILHWHSDVVPSRLDRKMAVLYPFYRQWESLLLKQAARVITTSDAYFRSSEALRPYQKKCRTIPLGMNPQRVRQARRGCSDREDETLKVLSVGRFAYYKGFEYLVRAAESVPEARFILVGDGPRRPAIEREISRKNLTERVLLPGKVDAVRLNAYLAECDIFCLPSIERTEAFGLVLLEAMSLGKPLVTTAIEGSGVTEVNRHGISGLLVPPEDAQALAEAIHRLRKNQRERKEMGKRAGNRFASRFHIQEVASKINGVYEAALE
jgi:glycosyltransferase involved in cell wall biosynthesis